MLSRVTFVIICALLGGCHVQETGSFLKIHSLQAPVTRGVATIFDEGAGIVSNHAPVEAKCPMYSNEDIVRVCDKTKDAVVVSVLPRQLDAVSPDDQAVLFEIMITSCNGQDIWVENFVFNIDIPQGNHDEDMVYSFFHRDGTTNLIEFEVADGVSHETLVSSAFIQENSSSNVTVYLPRSVDDEDQIHHKVSSDDVFDLTGWFDFPVDGKLGRYDLSLDYVDVVDQKGSWLDAVVLCNDKRNLKQLTVR